MIDGAIQAVRDGRNGAQPQSRPEVQRRCRMNGFEKIARAAVLGCALLEPHSDTDDQTAYLDAIGQLKRDDDAVLMLIAMKLLQGSPYQMTSNDPGRIRQGHDPRHAHRWLMSPFPFPWKLAALADHSRGLGLFFVSGCANSA